MKIYSDTLTASVMRSALADARPEAPNLTLHDTLITTSGRRRKITFDVMLEGDGPHHTRWTNSGSRGSGGHRAATWMDWGWWAAVMFRHEPTAVIGQYDGLAQFLETTAADMAYRVGDSCKDASALNFRRCNAAIWKPGTSPFALVDQLCPPDRLINLTQPPVVEAWLAS